MFESLGSKMKNSVSNVAKILPLICVIILLAALILFSAWKLAIYFNTFMYLSKKQNYEKVNYMVNSSFYKYFYSNKLFNGFINIEGIFTIILLLLSFFAFFGFLFRNNINLGYLNYYYGDKVEYTFVNIFINNIIILAIIYCSAYLYWFSYYKVEDDKLEVKDDALKKFITDNLSYEFLYNYYKATASKDDKTQRYTINNFVYTTTNDISKNNIELYKLCFTANIINDTERFKYIKNAIVDSVKDMNLIGDDTVNIDRLKKELKAKLKNTYIIANYNHNNNRALPPLDILINNININITSTPSNPSGTNIKAALITVYDNIMKGDESVKDMQAQHGIALVHFIDTIKIYKEVYDRNSTYYLVSLLITNFLISYAVLIFIYIFIKIFSNFELFERFYNIYKFKTDLLNYGIFILIFYYFVSCPIIIFGFN